MSKYIIDVDALKDCINLLPIPYRVNEIDMVCLNEVQAMIDKFPKDKYGNEYEATLKKLVELNKNNNTNYDILTGKGLSKI